MKKHLRIATVAFSVLALALVGCEDDNGDDNGVLDDNGVEDTDDGLDDEGDDMEDDGLDDEEEL